jgi:RNA-binding protein
MPLTGKQARHLRALAHHLDPVVHVGAAGLTDAVAEKVATELDNHELIKVKVGQNSALGAREMAPLLAERTGSEVAQVIGRMVVLYKARAEKPTIVLPEAAT